MQALSTASSQQQSNFLAEYYTVDEKTLRDDLMKASRLTPLDRKNIEAQAYEFVNQIRSEKSSKQMIDTFLQEYGLSTQEGLTLMRLAEALIRTPDFATEQLLIRDKLISGDWATHANKSDSFLVNQTTTGLRAAKKWIEVSGGITAKNLAVRLGDRVMRLAVSRAMAMMGEHFVLGQDIQEAVKKSHAASRDGFTHSYDMLGEAAHTEKDAARYFEAYLAAINHLADKEERGNHISDTAGISVKLSALHPRYEYAKREDCVPVLVERLVELAKAAKSKSLSLTIDAEEADRLEISLIIFNALLQHTELANWDGLGIVIQAYQRRASRTIDTVIDSARKAGRRICVRLVKGAYWDMEIKRAQELGLSSYPVFTRKENTDISFVACARRLLDASDIIFPQFATHNALSAATVIYMAGDNTGYEFQRLHGMGEALYQNLVKQSAVKCRIYAPVGNHKDLLPYLVRRLLENGANSSFVNQLFDEDISIGEMVEDPFKLAAEASSAANSRITAPLDLFSGERQLAAGLDITQSNIASKLGVLLEDYKPYQAASLVNGRACKSKPINVYNPAHKDQCVGSYQPAKINDIDRAIKSAKASKWSTHFTAAERASCLDKTADLLEENIYELLKLCTVEAGKTYLDGVAEVREAVDFCRYYAQQARRTKISSRKPLGIVACISPWNFPLAIFLGQVAASLAVGNTVIAKPAEQTPLIAHKAVKLLFESGVPDDAVHLIMGDGAALGSYLTAHKDIQAVCFTGSTATAKKIAETLADTNRSTIPFIAETGGINAMIVDSTALLEQAVQDIVSSAFQSAGQRCSACRFVCVQDDIADAFIEMFSGAMKTLQLGDPALLHTDVGPIIDAQAHSKIAKYAESLKSHAAVIGRTILAENEMAESYIAPIAFEITSINDIKEEIFGPVLHVVRFKASDFENTILEINKLGFGLTMGLHSRIDERVNWVSENARVGNLYINRNQIGAVVGVQPFGGEGLSGTGPKAGGPHYLLRLSSRSVAPNQVVFDDQNLVKIEANTTALQDVTELTILAKKAALDWTARFSSQKRREFIESNMGGFIQDDGDFCKTLDCDTHEVLPGPTGESNSLTLHPRGTIVCIGPKSALLKQIALALYAGNSVLAIYDENLNEIKAVSKMLNSMSGVSNLVQVVSLDSLGSILLADIDGVAAEGEIRENIGSIICKREGAILPLLSSTSDPERFFLERTVTNNITAAGGNATLLTLN